MANDSLQKLRAEALSLSKSERAELAYSLFASLDAPPDVAEAWERELAKRVAEVDAGAAVVVDRDEFRRRMQARLASN
jgi:putative addiction module component (TIGR02574 family)